MHHVPQYEPRDVWTRRERRRDESRSPVPGVDLVAEGFANGERCRRYGEAGKLLLDLPTAPHRSPLKREKENVRDSGAAYAVIDRRKREETRL